MILFVICRFPSFTYFRFLISVSALLLARSLLVHHPFASITLDAFFALDCNASSSPLRSGCGVCLVVMCARYFRYIRLSSRAMSSPFIGIPSYSSYTFACARVNVCFRHIVIRTTVLITASVQSYCHSAEHLTCTLSRCERRAHTRTRPGPPSHVAPAAGSPPASLERD